jgi:hypothetical protein
MRSARPSSIKQRALPLFTAQLSDSELTSWIPVRFSTFDDPEEVLEPSKATLVRLETGLLLVLLYGLRSQTLTVSFPQDADARASFRDFLSEVPQLSSRLTWRRPGLVPSRIARGIARKTQEGVNARGETTPKSGIFKVQPLKAAKRQFGGPQAGKKTAG